MAGIFICYRRADAEGWAGRLYDSLKAELGRTKIFRDIDDIPPGVEFDTYINDAVGSCDVLIALIGPRWLTVTDKNGLRRLDDPKDFTRLEILVALKRNVRVIPGLVGGMRMPDADDFPEDLKPLAHRQAYELSDHRWNYDCRKLVDVLTPLVKPDPIKPDPRRWVQNTTIVGIALVAVVAAIYLMNRNDRWGKISPPPPKAGTPVSFSNPMLGQYRLDACRTTGKECGEPAASDWCRTKGYASAINFEIDADVAKRGITTKSIGKGELCRYRDCDSFSSITCQ